MPLIRKCPSLGNPLSWSPAPPMSVFLCLFSSESRAVVRSLRAAFSGLFLNLFCCFESGIPRRCRLKLRGFRTFTHSDGLPPLFRDPHRRRLVLGCNQGHSFFRRLHKCWTQVSPFRGTVSVLLFHATTTAAFPPSRRSGRLVLPWFFLPRRVPNPRLFSN